MKFHMQMSRINSAKETKRELFESISEQKHTNSKMHITLQSIQEKLHELLRQEADEKEMHDEHIKNSTSNFSEKETTFQTVIMNEGLPKKISS